MKHKHYIQSTTKHGIKGLTFMEHSVNINAQFKFIKENIDLNIFNV